MKTGLKYSLAGRLTGPDFKTDADIFLTSRFAKVILSWKWPSEAKKDRISKFSLSSSLYVYASVVKQNFLLVPLKAAAVILIVAIITSAALMFLWQRQITLWGWIIRGLFLFLGVSGLFCDADWEDIKNTGLIFRPMGRARENGDQLK